MSSPQEQISVIIPTLDERRALPRALASATGIPNVEVIVADGGSGDGTVEIARDWGCRVISTSTGRARQMNRGAEGSLSDYLVFLHADTRLPQGFEGGVRETLTDPRVAAGAFQLRIDGARGFLCLIEAGANRRSRYLQMPYGDQAIFVRTELFREVGGYPDLPIMEDFELIRKLRRRGRIAVAPYSVLTSGRRWKDLGILRTTLLNQIVVLAYLAGVQPTRIASWYRRAPGRVEHRNTSSMPPSG